jgi:hypothetical protein
LHALTAHDDSNINEGTVTHGRIVPMIESHRVFDAFVRLEGFLKPQ